MHDSINAACCGSMLFQNSEHFSEILSSTDFRKVTLQWLSLHRGKYRWPFCFVCRYLYSLLAPR